MWGCAFGGLVMDGSSPAVLSMAAHSSNEESEVLAQASR
jgi:hypothetical protein